MSCRTASRSHILDRTCVNYPLSIGEATDGEDADLRFDPRDLVDLDLPPLERPTFLAIISSHVLAAALLKRSNGVVDGLGQVRGREPEPGIVTSGDDLAGLTRFMAPGTTSYTAADVIARLLST